MEPEFTRDMPECDKWNMEPTFRYDENEPTTYELAEQELKEQEEYYKHKDDDKI